jgi:hypothetical protein
MRLAVTVMATNLSLLRKHWAKNSILKDVTGTNTPLSKEVGGMIILIDWDNKKILKQLSFEKPTGISFDGMNYYVACLVEDNIAVLDKDLKEVKRINNPLFNLPHSVELDGENILIANTGLDEALTVNKDGIEFNHWSALDNGYDKDPFGNKRIVDRKKSHTDITYPTLEHTTHLNYFNKIGGAYFVTLFHQGKILRSDDGVSYTTVVSNLKNPHAIRKTTDGYIISDTKNNQVILTDNKFNIKDKINLGFDWVQDAFETTSKTYIAIDANNNRIVEFNNKKEIVSEWRASSEWRLFQAIEVPN